MPFGGLAPMPVRLGPSQDGGITAAQHARFAADLAAVSRTVPAIALTVSVDRVAGTVTVLRYAGRNGNGVQFAPMASVSGSTVTVELAATTNAAGYTVDVASHLSTNWAPIIRDVTGGGYCAVTVAADLYTFTFTLSTTGTRTVDIRIFGSAQSVNIGDYGGDTEKRNSETEGSATYAYQWYRMLKSAEGSAYTTRDDSVRAWEVKAHARAIGHAQRLSEMLAASGSPGSADALLPRWASWLGVQQANVPQWQVRRDCEIRFSDYAEPSADYIKQGVAAILGPAFNSIATPNIGDLSTWPPATYMPGYIAGDATYDISGNGMFSSSRGTICVVVNRGIYTDAELIDLMGREVAVWLANNLPATKSWYWSVSAPGGFTLGVSTMGFDSL